MKCFHPYLVNNIFSRANFLEMIKVKFGHEQGISLNSPRLKDRAMNCPSVGIKIALKCVLT